VLRSIYHLVFNLQASQHFHCFPHLSERFRVFRAPLQASQHFHCFRIYRETLSRFSCAFTSWPERIPSWRHRCPASAACPARRRRR
ncbi:hypothetical protein ABLN72_05530, partial [Mycobacterium tuberculosis]